jgi:hypothetical protein
MLIDDTRKYLPHAVPSSMLSAGIQMTRVHETKARNISYSTHNMPHHQRHPHTASREQKQKLVHVQVINVLPE